MAVLGYNYVNKRKGDTKMAKDTCKDEAYIAGKEAYKKKQQMKRFREACAKERDKRRGDARAKVRGAKREFVNEVANTPDENESEA